MRTRIATLPIAALLIAALAGASFFAGQAHERSRASAATQTQLQAQQAQARRTESWLANERSNQQNGLGLKLHKQAQQLHQDQKQAHEQHQTLAADMRSGAVRVRVPIVPALPAHCPAPGLSATGHAAAAPEPAHAQLEPAAAADLAAIVHDGDSAIRELNHCIAQYGEVKTMMERWQRSLQEGEHAQAQ